MPGSPVFTLFPHSAFDLTVFLGIMLICETTPVPAPQATQPALSMCADEFLRLQQLKHTTQQLWCRTSKLGQLWATVAMGQGWTF